MKKNKPFLMEIWDFVKQHKAWWLAPLLLILALISALTITLQSSQVTPFIYALF